MYNALLLSEGGGIISQSSVSPQMGTACLMIGIGGTGLVALRRVKKEVFQHLDPDDPSAAIPRYSKIAFLGIDTDTDDLTVENPDITELQADEQWSVNIPALGLMLKSNEAKKDPCLSWLSTNIQMQGDKGAGGNRQAGRFCLFKKAGALRTKLDQLIKQTMAASGKPNIQVHIFAGISGGTGSGCFLDVCYILRDLLANTNSTVCGYFFLADTQLYRSGIKGNGPVENYNKRNGYAALRDLDYCMSIPSSGNVFQEDYAPGFHVESRLAPVDLCHLISATDTNGVIKPDGFVYSMNVVAEYVLTYLSDVNATESEKQNDSKGLTIEGFTVNVNQALSTIKPRIGAERKYNIVGASSAELPLTHIGTYLASVTYSKMKPSLGRHSSKLLCDQFAQRVGCTTGGLIAELSRGVSTAINFNPEPEKIDHLDETLQNWYHLVPSLHGPVVACRTTALGKIQANFSAQCRDLDSYDAKHNDAIENPTFVLRLFNALVTTATNPAEGPTMAADLLHGNGIHDLRAVLKGIEKDITEKEDNFKANVPLRVQDIINAAHRYNKSAVGWKKKLDAYQDAWTEYTKLQINLELCAKLKNLIPVLERLLDAMYRNYFEPLASMLAELTQTFDMNLRWLADPKHKQNESFSWRIFEYDDVKEELDTTVLKFQDADVEHQNFVDYLLENYREWSSNGRSTYRIAHCINEYMVKRFRETLTRTVDNFLLSAYRLNDENALPGVIQKKLLNAVSLKASPLFWKNPTFQLDDTTTVSNNVLSIPAGSAAIDSAAKDFAIGTPNVVVRRSTLADRVSCLRFVSGIPLYAYQGIDALKGPYDSSNDPGLHLHERDVNWRQTLPAPVPYSVQAIHQKTTEEEDALAALYDRAVQERVVCPQSRKYPDSYVVRKLPNTERVVSPYQKDLYYFAGKLNLADLERDMTKLKAERESLLPETVSEQDSLPLLNDGYRDAENPELDATETVRKDYFIRFQAIHQTASDSLDELKRIDDKLAEMEGWKHEQDEMDGKIKRYMMLDMMGYLSREKDSTVKLQLRFTYKGKDMKIQVCDNDSHYRRAPEYQVFLALDEIDRQQMEALDAEIAKKYKEPTAAWRAPLKRMEETSTEERIEEYENLFSNDVNREAIPAFYRSLRSMAQEELTILPPDPSESKPQQKNDLNESWKCKCGNLNAAEDLWCGECGREKPKPLAESWTCKNGHIVPWTKKFCTKCGPGGGKRPDLLVQAWICPECGTQNEAGDSWCGECGNARP